MEVHIQKCQECQSTDVCNMLVSEPGRPQTIYAKCTSCGQLVARFLLSDYYHHGKGIESWLRSLGPAAFESGRDFHDEFSRVQTAALAGFEAACRRLEEQKQVEPP